MTPTEKRIYALAQKWANATTRVPKSYNATIWKGRRYERRFIGRALLKLFEETKGIK